MVRKRRIRVSRFGDNGLKKIKEMFDIGSKPTRVEIDKAKKELSNLKQIDK